jgi:hypothetical protein
MDSAATELIVGPLDRPVREVKLLATGKPLTFHTNGKNTSIPLNKELWEQGIPVFEVG